MASLRQPCRPPRRPAPGQRPLAVLHRRAAEPSRSSCSASRAARLSIVDRRPAGLRRCAAVRHPSGRDGRPDQPRDPEPHPRRQPRASHAAHARIQAVIYDIPLKAIAYTLPAGHRLQAGALHQLLAVDLANTDAGDDHGAFRLRYPARAFPCGHRRPRTGATRSAGRRPRHGSPTRSCASGGRTSPSRATWRREPSPTPCGGRCGAPGVCRTESSTGTTTRARLRSPKATRCRPRRSAARTLEIRRGEWRTRIEMTADMSSTSTELSTVGHARGVRGRRSRLRQGVRRDGAP